MASYKEQILRGTNELSFSAKFQNPRHVLHVPTVTLEAISESENKSFVSKLTPAVQATLM